MYSLASLVALCVVAYVLWAYIIVPAFVSPLAKIPNAHFTAPFSSLWITWRRYREQENRTVHAAHEKHGKIVRLGPKEVSINSVQDGIRMVYTGGFEKGDWYPAQFNNFSLPCMFSMRKSKPHSVRKRMVSHLYSKSYLQSSVDLQKASSLIAYDRLLPLVESAAEHGKDVDLFHLNLCTAIDLFTAFAFGFGNHSDFLRDTEAGRKWMSAYQSRHPYRFWDAELPLLTEMSKKVGLPLVPQLVDRATAYMENWTLGKCKRAVGWTRSSSNDAESQVRTPAVVYDQLTAAVKATTADDPFLGPPDMQVASELQDHLQAAHETSGITLTYLFWELSCNRAVQSKLREELRTLSPPIGTSSTQNGRDIPSPKTLDSLPFLHAVIMETLRLHGAIPGSQPRETPFPPKSVAGSPLLDPGTRISAQAYSLHRNAEVFPEPEAWKPSRWTDSAEDQKAEMSKWFWAFGSGGRMCVGSNFAMQSMKLVVTAIYTNYATHIIDDTGIEQVDGFTAYPKGKRLIGRFERV